MTQSVETRRFGMHPQIIFDVIQRQSGLFWRAVQELVTNSLDAKATFCSITLSPTSFVIEDDGGGFVGREAIEQFFETFGTPHNEANRGNRVGRYRMGRGSIMSHASTVWRSGLFTMDVDIKHRGLDYKLLTHPEAHRGCRIEGTFYNRLSMQDYNSALRDIRRACEYLPFKVLLNGDPISIPWSSVKWTHEDENCLLLSRPGSTLSLYNYGAYICDRSEFHAGMTGIIVSKKPMELNYPRSEVMENECPVWKAIKPVMTRFVSKERRDRPTTLTHGQRLHLLKAMVLDGDLSDLDLAMTAPVFPLSPTGWASIEQLDTAMRTKEGVVLSDGTDRPLDEAIFHARVAPVLSPDLLQLFNQSTVDGVRDLIVAFANGVRRQQPYPRLSSLVHAQANWLPSSHYAGQFATEKKRLHRNDLTPIEQTALSVAVAMNDDVAQGVRRALGLDVDALPVRSLHPGTSASAAAWTDGATYIALERRLLKRSIRDFAGLSELAATLVHEYLHLSDDSGSHQHDSDFMQRFHDVSMTGVVGEAVLSGMKRVLRGATSHRASAFKLPAKLVRQVDLITSLPTAPSEGKIEAVEDEEPDADAAALPPAGPADTPACHAVS